MTRDPTVPPDPSFAANLDTATADALQAALDNTPLERIHWQVWFLSAMGVFLDGFDLFIISVALPLIAHQFNTDPWTLGLIGAAAPLGAMLGAMILGPFTDRWGRKAMYIVDLLFFIVFAGLSMLAWDATSLIVFRLLLGIGIGADYPISASYIAEFMPARVRGKMLVAAFSFQAVGALIGAAMGLAILLLDPTDSAWRWMLGLGVVPALAILVLRTQVPESPRWYLCRGEVQAALVAARVILGDRFTVGGAAAEACARPLERVPPAPRQPVTILLTRPYLRRTVLTCVPWFLMDIALYGIGIFTPAILALIFTGRHPLHALNLAQDVMIQHDIRATMGAVFLDLFLVVGFALSIGLVERWGRIRLQLLGFIGMAAGMGLKILAGGLSGGEAAHLGLVFTGFALFNLMVNLGPNATTYLLPAELFPTQLRASGHGLAAASGKVGAVVGIFFLPVLLKDWGMGVTMGLVAAASVLGAGVAAVLGLETRGRSLEELATGRSTLHRLAKR